MAFSLFGHALRLPVIGSPLFIVSGPELVIAQCRSGIIGSFPALNARTPEILSSWLTQITKELAAPNDKTVTAPYAVNQICHKSNTRLLEDLELCVKFQVPIVITSLQVNKQVIDAVHSYGGKVLHDVISIRHAKKALSLGVDGLIPVCAGAGGHAGTLSPFALVRELRALPFTGPLALSGAIADGSSVLSSLAVGADLAYMGTRFVATKEANAVDAYKDMITESSAADIVYSSLFTGVHGNYLKGSIEKSGMDPNNLEKSDPSKMNFASAKKGGEAQGPKAWKDIWGSGQGIGCINDVPAVSDLVDRLEGEFNEAVAKLRVTTAGVPPGAKAKL